MQRVHAERPALPVVLVTAHATVETAVEALRHGAYHYLVKPIRWDELALVLGQAVSHERARRDLERLRGELDRVAGFEEMVGDSPAMKEVFRIVNQVADSDASVLLRGETGTGRSSWRAPFTSTLPGGGGRSWRSTAPRCHGSFMESEFFGHEKGAFTGAVARRQGRFQQAEGGTLFLDEVGDLDLAVQAKLLRALQEREISRVGGRASRARRRPGGGGHQPGPGGAGEGGTLPRRPLLPAERDPAAPAAPARAARRRPGARRSLRLLLRGAAGAGRSAPAARGAGRGLRVRLAGQRPGTPEPLRAGRAHGTGTRLLRSSAGPPGRFLRSPRRRSFPFRCSTPGPGWWSASSAST